MQRNALGTLSKSFLVSSQQEMVIGPIKAGMAVDSHTQQPCGSQCREFPLLLPGGCPLHRCADESAGCHEKDRDRIFPVPVFLSRFSIHLFLNRFAERRSRQTAQCSLPELPGQALSHISHTVDDLIDRHSALDPRQGHVRAADGRTRLQRARCPQRTAADAVGIFQENGHR